VKKKAESKSAGQKLELKAFLKFLGQKKIAGVSFLLFFLSLFFLFSQNFSRQPSTSTQVKKIQSASLSLSELTKLPQNTTGQPAPELTARTALVIDYGSDSILYQKNARSTHLPASTTKIMTALIALDSFGLDQVLTVPKLDYEGQDIQLRLGEQMTLENLLYALLVASANDAAETLAANYPGGRAAFVAAMNQRAEELSLDNTHFVNPTGFDEPGQYMTAFDLVKLAKKLLSHPLLAQIVATQKTSVYNVDKTIVHPITNINQLLGKIPGVRGVKTGWTTSAGECLTAFVERNGVGVITVVMGSEDRFGETKNLIEWVFANHVWEIPNL
jgi:D-alanyl-D-alanine carboxypeptidase